MDEGFQSLPEDESDEGSLSLPEDELDEGVQCLPLDEDGLPGEQVPPPLMDIKPWFLFLMSNQVQVSRERNGEPRPVNLAIDLNGVIS